MKLKCLIPLALCAALSVAQEPWSSPRRGSWVRTGYRQPGDVDLGSGVQFELNVGGDTVVNRAARFLAVDLERLGVRKVRLECRGPGHGARIRVEVVPDSKMPESFRIVTDAHGIVVRGSDRHGAAFGLYELSERLGIDPLYRWTGFGPTRHEELTMRAVDFRQGPPAVRWRGLFHDDEDILPRPLDLNGLPDANGTVPKEWYERYFETALRLRMNMVAPWVRTVRNPEIRKMASDWGLTYTSHHYDILLSDPYHFGRGLAQARGVAPVWDWLTNREGMVKYWLAGVQENKGLDAIYPIGLRGTNDYGYRFPADWSEDRRIEAFNEALKVQASIVHREVGHGKPKLMHFTMYTEMLPYYQTGKLMVPDGTIIVWPDDNDGLMRGLPSPGALGKHGVYYHLAYLGATSITKQIHQTVPLGRVEHEFRKVFESGATEYALVNVSELREYVMATRFLADLFWHGHQAFHEPDASGRFLNWWVTEYFGNSNAAEAVRAYFASIPRAVDLAVGGHKAFGALVSLEKKLRGEPFTPALPETLPMLESRAAVAQKLKGILGRTREQIDDPDSVRFFFENIEVPAAIDRLNALASIELVRAMSETSHARTIERCKTAARYLDMLETILRRAERSPFENWYGPTWIGHRTQAINEPRKRLMALLDLRPQAVR